MRQQKQRILFLPSITIPEDYGGITHQREFLYNLSKDSDVYVVSTKKKKIELVDPDETTISPVLKRNLLSLARHMFNTVHLGLREIRKRNIQLIYARHGISTLPAVFLGRISKTQVVIEFNGILGDEFAASKRWRGWVTALRILDRIGCSRPTNIIAVTPGIARYLENEFNKSPHNIVVIPNGANTDVFRPLDKENCREKLGLDKKKKYVCFVGNLAPWQGVDYLIKSIPIIAKDFPGIHILIVGSGESLDKLRSIASEEKVRDYVIFTNSVAYDMVPFYVCASDICVAPFVKERNQRIGLSPLKIYEYLSCGRPVVASDVGNLDFIQEEGLGILVKPENPEDLAHGIVQMMRKGERLSEIGLQGRKYILENHSWECLVKRISEFCKEVIEGRAQ